MKINIWRYITDARYRKGILAFNLSDSYIFDVETTDGRVVVEFKVGDSKVELAHKDTELKQALENLTESARLSLTMRSGEGFETFGMSGRKKVEG